ncbi:MAG: alkaline phosphatase family protein, partial [Planctomycetota bacterium]
MSLPRWTAYPALGVLGLFLLTAVPRRTSDEVPAKTKYERVVVLGIDGLDPEILAEVVERFPERMPNFIKLIEEGGIHSLGTSIPPQSPVAWSNFITGRDPGGHGIFDFIHRDPVTRGPIGSTSKTEAGSHLSLWGDWQFPLGGASESNRSGRSFWEVLAENDIPADIWRMPANFPVEPSKGVSFPGMMTPTLESAYGTYIVYTTDPPVETQRSGGRYVSVRNFDGVISTRVEGPANPFKEGNPQDSVPLVIYVDEEAGAAAIQIDGGSPLVADVGEWTDFTSVDFELLPMGSVLPGGQMTGTVRFFVRSLAPEFQMYMSPVNFDPMAPATPMSEPSTASEDLAAAIGFYYTQGMAEEVNALKDGAISEEDFIDQAGLVYDERVRMMDYALDRYLENEEGGLLFFYYSTVDLCCHMLWDHFDERHPFHRAAIARGSTERWTERAGSTWKDVVYDLYM